MGTNVIQIDFTKEAQEAENQLMHDIKNKKNIIDPKKKNDIEKKAREAAINVFVLHGKGISHGKTFTPKKFKKSVFVSGGRRMITTGGGEIEIDNEEENIRILIEKSFMSTGIFPQRIRDILQLCGFTCNIITEDAHTKKEPKISYKTITGTSLLELCDQTCLMENIWRMFPRDHSFEVQKKNDAGSYEREITIQILGNSIESEKDITPFMKSLREIYIWLICTTH